MDYTLREIGHGDLEPVLRIFNHFVRESFAAYPDEEVGAWFVEVLRPDTRYPFLVVEYGEEVVGFGCLRPFRRGKVFSRTAELTYFVLPEHCGRGIGSRLLDQLEEWAKGRGIDNLLANVSSRNEESIGFHKAKGFVECGRFLDVGRKFEEDFDIIWLQRRI